jgi:carboxypeptidase family protein
MNCRSLFLLAALGAALVSGCSGEKKAVAAQPESHDEGSVPPRPSVVEVPTAAYREIAVTAPGRITGTVEFKGMFPADSMIRPAAEQAGCKPIITDKRVQHSGTKVIGAAIWLTDIRQGKSRPIERRFELVNEDCLLDPRLQIVQASGTLNIISDDAALHHNRIINVGTGKMEAMAPFNDNGQVVPFDKLLTTPAELEVLCDLHPWSRAWIVVLDHPYYAMSSKSGDFTIDGIPPGTYHLRAWHPALGRADQTITVAAGGQSAVSLELTAAPPTPPSAGPATQPAGGGSTAPNG